MRYNHVVQMLNLNCEGSVVRIDPPAIHYQGDLEYEAFPGRKGAARLLEILQDLGTVLLVERGGVGVVCEIVGVRTSQVYDHYIAVGEASRGESFEATCGGVQIADLIIRVGSQTCSAFEFFAGEGGYMQDNQRKFPKPSPKYIVRNSELLTNNE